jgi:hypothetical protein
MPYAEIPPDKLQHLEMFGHQLLEESASQILTACGRGVCVIDKARPIVWFESTEDAMQCGAIAIVQGPSKR